MYRLIYKSDNVAKMSWAVATGILSSSIRNNQQAGITGVLLMGKKHFLQVLEGEFEAVNGSFERIVKDPRHENVRIVAFGPVEERLFSQWEMRGVGVFEFDPPVSQTLIEKYGEEDGELRFPETPWEALSLIDEIQRIEDVPEWDEETHA